MAPRGYSPPTNAFPPRPFSLFYIPFLTFFEIRLQVSPRSTIFFSLLLFLLLFHLFLAPPPYSHSVIRLFCLDIVWNSFTRFLELIFLVCFLFRFCCCISISFFSFFILFCFSSAIKRVSLKALDLMDLFSRVNANGIRLAHYTPVA